MLAERRSLEDGAARGGTAIFRCRACGKRVRQDDPRCPVHGPVQVEEAIDIETTQVSPVALPRFPRHVVTRIIGQGGFGTVFEATSDDGRPVAIKLARSDRLDAGDRLMNEIKVLADVGPPFVPVVYDWARLADGSPYLVMERIDAPPLAARLVAGADPIPIPLVLSLGLAILAALEAVHARGYVHRDLKPENILVSADLQATIIDLGLVASTVEAATASDLALDAAVGTADYMAPEQCEGLADVDVRADLYALGVILYELIAGRPPFWGPPAVVREAHRSRRPPPLAAVGARRAIPKALEDAVIRCLAKDRQDRFESAAALRAALERATADQGRPAASPSSVRISNIPMRASSDPGERRTVGILFFEAQADLLVIQREIAALGGQIARAAGERYAAVFGQEAAENPARQAWSAARELLDRGLCARVRLDLASVTVQSRRGGAKRFMSPILAQSDRYPTDRDPAGLSVTPAAEAEIGVDEPSHAPLIGRDPIVSALLAGARRAIDAAIPTVVRVVADAGHGKSHLARVLGVRLRALDLPAEVLDLRAREPAFSGADQTIGDLRALLGFIEPAGFHAAPGALRSALAAAAGEALRRRAAARPLLVVLDDAQHADDATLAALEYAALAEARAPIWVCALGRPIFEEQRPAWGERAARREAYRLGPLDPASAAALCRRLLLPVENVPDSAVQGLIERAQSIPFFLVELIRGLRRDGLVRRHPRGDAFYLATDQIDHLPDLPLIEWLARREIDALPPALSAHARLLALLGDEVVQEDVEGVLRRLERQGGDVEFPLDVKIAIQRLLAAGVLIRHRDRGTGFRHALVREAIAREIPEALARRIHLAAVEHHRGAPSGADADRRLAQLAFHAARAGLAELAERTYLELGERSAARHAYMEAELLYSRALAQADSAEDPRRATAYRGRGVMRYRLGRHHDALADLSRAREMADRRGDVAEVIEILLDEATALDWMDDYRSSAERVEQARSLLPRVSSPLLEARLLLGSGRSLHRASREEEAAALLDRAAAAAEALGEEGYETLVIALLMLGFILPGLGKIGDARRALDRAIALCEAHGDAIHLGAAINNRALLWGYLGDKARMVADFERGLSISREQGQGTLEIIGRFNLGEFLYLMDEVDAADQHVLCAIDLEQQRAGDAARGVAALLMARIQLYRGDGEAALEIVARIRAQQAKARASGHTDRLLAPAEEVLCAMIERSIGDADDAAWEELEARSARSSIGQERIEVLEARALADLRRGRTERARRQLEKAIDLAARIPNVMGERLRRWLREAGGGEGAG